MYSIIYFQNELDFFFFSINIKIKCSKEIEEHNHIKNHKMFN